MIISSKDLTKYRNVAGIYRFRNKINNKSYVGQSLTIGKRIREHLCALNNPSHQYLIHKSIIKYGIDSFEIEILSTFEKKGDIKNILNLAEQIYIDFYDSFKNGYNLTAGGDSMHKRKWTEEQRTRMSNLMTGRKRSKDYIDPRAKPVYLYNIKTGTFYYVDCVKFVKDKVDHNLQIKQVEACVTNRHYTTKGYICARSMEELNNKIKLFKQKCK